MTNLQIIEGFAIYAGWWLLALLIFSGIVFILWTAIIIVTYNKETKRHREMVKKYKAGYIPRKRNDWSE